MFDGLSAWFSSSVTKKRRDLWVQHGGIETPLEDAQFIFSQDTTAVDTERVFESEPYIEEHLAVFHPNYVKECVKRGNIRHVVLGKYFFPPGDVQTIARQQLQYQWDFDGNTSDGEDINLSDGEEPAPVSRRGQNKEPAPVSRRGQNKEPVPVSTGQKKKPVPVLSGQNKEPGPVFTGQNKEPVPVSSCQNKEPVPVSRGQNKEPASARLSEQSKNSQQSKTTSSVLLESTRAAIPGTSKDANTKDHVKQSKGHSNKSVIDPTHSTQASICIDTGVEIDKSPRRSARTASDRNTSGVLQENSPTKRKSPRKCGETQCANLKRKHEETFTMQVSKDQNVINENEILRLEDLAKVSGDLHDFIIDTNGCELVAK